MTAILVMQLRDEGALRLTDRLDDHLPGVVYGDRTLRELLSHSSGHAGRASRSVVGAESRRLRRGAAGAGSTRPQAPFPAGRRVPLLEPRIRPARRGRRPQARRLLGGQLCTAGCSIRSACAVRRTSVPSTGRDRRTASTRSPGCSPRNRATTQERWRPQASSGARSEDLGRLAAFLADPDRVRAGAGHRLGDDRRTDRQSRRGGRRLLRSRPATRGGRATARTSVTPARCRASWPACSSTGLARTGCSMSGERRLPACARRVSRSTCCVSSRSSSRRIPQPWTPTVEVPPVVRDLVGLWYWGNLAFTMSYLGDRLIARRSCRDNATWFTVRLVDGGAAHRGHRLLRRGADCVADDPTGRSATSSARRSSSPGCPTTPQRRSPEDLPTANPRNSRPTSCTHRFPGVRGRPRKVSPRFCAGSASI